MTELAKQSQQSATRVLIGSPVQQKPEILQAFLTSLNRLQNIGLNLDYCLIDDNTNPESSRLLQEFTTHHPSLQLQPERHGPKTYHKNDTTHFWTDGLIWKVAAMKDVLIQVTLNHDYDYLFLIDSDILIHPNTINHLIETGKDIVSEIFWTRWYPGSPEEPQVWLRDQYTQFHQDRGEQLSDEEITKRKEHFLTQLREPGLYEVGGLGACTLLSRNALQRGVRFARIQNLSLWGEDRHFCVRAAAIGIPLYVDTHYPALHLYRDTDLTRVNEFFAECDVTPKSGDAKRKVVVPLLQHGPLPGRQITLSMIMKNEADRQLRKVLAEHRHYIDRAVIIDDGSTDNTVDVCCEMLEGIPYTIVSNTKSKFANEVQLRLQQWLETIRTNPEWILNLDADEMFEASFKDYVRQLVNQDNIDVYCFRLYDFWDENHYREDTYWQAHTVYRPFLVRYRENFDYRFKETAQHCGRFPENILALPYALCNLRLKHFGWATPQDRRQKYERYMQLDPDARYGWKEQYESILDENLHLVKWEE